MDEARDDAQESDEGIRDRLSSRGEDAVGDIVQAALDNPLLSQALQVALGARDAATQASARTMKGLNVASRAEVERLGRRLRSLSDRLEEVEDRLDELTRLRPPSPPPPPPPAPPPAPSPERAPPGPETRSSAPFPGRRRPDET